MYGVLECNSCVGAFGTIMCELCSEFLVLLHCKTAICWIYNNKIMQWRIQDFPNGGALFCRKWGGAHPVFR